GGGSAAEEPDHRPRRLLGGGRDWPRHRRAAECDQQFPPSDGDCHTPLPCEVRKGNDTTPRACSLHVRGGQDAGCFTSIVSFGFRSGKVQINGDATKWLRAAG